MTLDAPDVIPLLSAHICMGGSPIDWAQMHGIRYDRLIEWLYDDPERQRRYEAALEARGEWFLQRVLLELKRLATVDIREAYDEQGCLRPINTLSTDLAACLSQVKTRELYDSDGERIGQTVDVRLWDKAAALVSLGKSISMFIERHEHLHRVTVTTMETIKVETTDGQVIPLTFRLGEN